MPQPVTLAAHEIIGAMVMRECVDAAQCAGNDERRRAALVPFTQSANVATAAIFGWCVTCWVIGAGATHLAEAVYRQRQYIGRLVEQRRKLIDELIDERREEGEFESAKEISRLLAMRTWPAMTRSRSARSSSAA